MLWMSWEKLRDELEEAMSLIDEFETVDETFWFEKMPEMKVKLHLALEEAIKNADVEEID